MSLRPQQFQKLILHWFDQHGRKQLPWQHNKTPYRVWVSEIMLQQTQVNTVIPYFEQFMQRFPHLATLANAHEDEVLHLWTGLGYYSRARNLHHAAKMIMEEFDGNFPDTADKIQQLPGIGPSTAGAILSIAFGQPAAILDGNVKRVLARFHGITHPINEKKTENSLWDLAKRYALSARPADYTQAMMDLGATLCTRSKPQCERCPLAKYCWARQQGMAEQLPISKKARELPVRAATFIILKKSNQVLLQKRPPAGIWGGLWCFPEMMGEPEINKLRQFCQQHFHITVTNYQPLDPFRHTFSHYHLDIHPVIIPIKNKERGLNSSLNFLLDQESGQESTLAKPGKKTCFATDQAKNLGNYLNRVPKGHRIMEAGQQIWYNPLNPESVGLPQPVLSIVRKLI